MALSNAERQRRFRERHGTELRPERTPTGEETVIRAQRGRIAFLEDEVKCLKRLLAKREPVAHPFGHPSPAPKPGVQARR